MWSWHDSLPCLMLLSAAVVAAAAALPKLMELHSPRQVLIGRQPRGLVPPQQVVCWRVWSSTACTSSLVYW